MGSLKEDNVDSQNFAELLAHGPVPQVTTETKPFWDATAQHELNMPFCNDCARFFFYPRSHCRYCDSENIEWKRVSGRGRLISYVINHKPFPEFQTNDVQVIAIVELDEGVNLLTQLLLDDPSPAKLPLGLPLQVHFIERGGVNLPFFAPSTQEITHNA